MSDNPAAKPSGGILKWALWGAALIGVAAVLYIIGKSSTKSPEATPPPAAASATATGFAAKVSHASDGTPSPDYVFYDNDGKPLKVQDFKGKVVVMNLWASWCGPCKIEMPTLAKLQQAYAGKDVVVLAVSIDKPDAKAEAQAFLKTLPPLDFYNDPNTKLPWKLTPTAQGIPTTVIYGKDGLEHARVSGDVDWSGAEAKAAIDRILAQS